MGVFAAIGSKIYSIVAQILVQLGANETMYIQVGIFVITIAFLTTVVFSPYFKAADVRHKKTKGAHAVAKETVEEAKNLQLIYQNKAREINNKIKEIYDAKKSDGLKVSAETIAQAKKNAEATTQGARQNIEAQLKTAEQDIAKISNELSQTLVQNFEKGL